MKSSQSDLSKRGYVTEWDINKLNGASQIELLQLLHSESSTIRTAAAYNLTSFQDEATDELLQQLLVEKCLYTKIAICECLGEGNINTAKKMVTYLGKIGHNQHKQLPDKVSAKKSFPLPRDIIARTLSKMNTNIFPILIDVLESNDSLRICEVLDAIGFMAFYNSEVSNEKNAEIIYRTIEKYKNNDFIVWKSLLCLSAFPFSKSIDLLERYVVCDNLLGKEADRSIRLIKSNPL